MAGVRASGFVKKSIVAFARNLAEERHGERVEVLRFKRRKRKGLTKVPRDFGSLSLASEYLALVDFGRSCRVTFFSGNGAMIGALDISENDELRSWFEKNTTREYLWPPTPRIPALDEEIREFTAEFKKKGKELEMGMGLKLRSSLPALDLGEDFQGSGLFGSRREGDFLQIPSDLFETDEIDILLSHEVVRCFLPHFALIGSHSAFLSVMTAFQVLEGGQKLFLWEEAHYRGLIADMELTKDSFDPEIPRKAISFLRRLEVVQDIIPWKDVPNKKLWNCLLEAKHDGAFYSEAFRFLKRLIEGISVSLDCTFVVSCLSTLSGESGSEDLSDKLFVDIEDTPEVSGLQELYQGLREVKLGQASELSKNVRGRTGGVRWAHSQLVTWAEQNALSVDVIVKGFLYEDKSHVDLLVTNHTDLLLGEIVIEYSKTWDFRVR